MLFTFHSPFFSKAVEVTALPPVNSREVESEDLSKLNGRCATYALRRPPEYLSW